MRNKYSYLDYDDTVRLAVKGDADAIEELRLRTNYKNMSDECRRFLGLPTPIDERGYDRYYKMALKIGRNRCVDVRKLCRDAWR